MGYTTIIEINHDEVNDIFYNETTKKHFLLQIEEQIKACKYNSKSILGGKILDGFHRSGKHYDNWINCKKIMGWE